MFADAVRTLSFIRPPVRVYLQYTTNSKLFNLHLVPSPLLSSPPLSSQAVPEKMAPRNSLSGSASRRNAPDANTEGGAGGGLGAGAVMMVMSCCQNLIGVLHMGLGVSKWR